MTCETGGSGGCRADAAKNADKEHTLRTFLSELYEPRARESQ